MYPDAQTQRYVTALGYAPAEIWRGCDECVAGSPWTQAHAANAARVALGMYILRHWIAAAAGQAGPAGTVRGWWRCRPCNARRDGASSSKHIAAGAIDVDFTREQRQGFARLLDAYGAPMLCQYIGRYVGCEHPGLIRYPSGAIHLDTVVAAVDGVEPRSRTFIDLQ